MDGVFRNYCDMYLAPSVFPCYRVRERLRKMKGQIRTLCADFLAYALCDAVINAFFSTLEKRGDEVEEVEERVIASPPTRYSTKSAWRSNGYTAVLLVMAAIAVGMLVYFRRKKWL